MKSVKSSPVVTNSPRLLGRSFGNLMLAAAASQSTMCGNNSSRPANKCDPSRRSPIVLSTIQCNRTCSNCCSNSTIASGVLAPTTLSFASCAATKHSLRAVCSNALPRTSRQPLFCRIRKPSSLLPQPFRRNQRRSILTSADRTPDLIAASGPSAVLINGRRSNSGSSKEDSVTIARRLTSSAGIVGTIRAPFCGNNRARSSTDCNVWSSSK